MVGLREFANHVGRDPALISRLVKRGIIPRTEDGKIPLEEGLQAFSLYESSPKNTGGRPRKEKTEAAPAPKPKPKPKAKSVPAPSPHENHAPVEAAAPPPSMSAPQLDTQGRQSAVAINTSMNKAKLVEKTYQAKLRELEFKLKSGELLEKTKVEAEASWLAEQVKAKLNAIPPRISAMCEGRIAREIEEIITDAINSALAELQKCEYMGEQ